ncbi:hypothetical protein [Geodermatophilus sp. URMC 60]
MDVTTVNDRHLYRATVVLRDAHDPMGQVELPARIVRFGPPGWLTVVHGAAGTGVIALYPAARVLEVSDLGEAGPPAQDPAGD